MTLHLLKNPVSQAALSLLAAQASSPAVVFLSASEPPPTLSNCTVYRLRENATAQDTGTISYDQLVSMLFKAERVVTW